MSSEWMRAGWIAVLAIATGCGKKSDNQTTKKPPPPPVAAKLETAQPGTTPQRLVLTGILAANWRTELTADTQGKVTDVLHERGETIHKGDPLLQLDVRTAALGAREVQANLNSARAQRELAEQECQRTKALLDKGAITKSEYDRQMTQCTAALQQVSALEARSAMMSKSVADGIVRAPFSGVISQRMVSPGEWVAPGRPLFVLVDTSQLRVELSVPEAAVRTIHDKQVVELRAVANPDQVYLAKVSRIGAEIGRTRSLIVEATLDNPPADKSLVPGMFVEASIQTDDLLRVVIVPETAIARRCTSASKPSPATAGSGSPASGSASAPAAPTAPTTKCRAKPRVFVVGKDGEVEERLVQLGPVPAAGKLSIADGISPGERFVAVVTDDIVDGARVKE